MTELLTLKGQAVARASWGGGVRGGGLQMTSDGAPPPAGTLQPPLAISSLATRLAPERRALGSRKFSRPCAGLFGDPAAQRYRQR